MQKYVKIDIQIPVQKKIAMQMTDKNKITVHK